MGAIRRVHEAVGDEQEKQQESMAIKEVHPSVVRTSKNTHPIHTQQRTPLPSRRGRAPCVLDARSEGDNSSIIPYLKIYVFHSAESLEGQRIVE